MFFRAFFTLAGASFAAVKAVDLCAWSSLEGCFDSAVCCIGAVEHVCCNSILSDYGFSVQYTDLPGPVSDGQAWASANCVANPLGNCFASLAINTEASGTGDFCFRGVGKINSLSWTHRASKRADVGFMETMLANVFKFTVDGAEKAIQIPAGEGSVDTVLALYKAINFTGLATYYASAN
ncbi:hypothetical protein C8R47DRAFT_1214056 [Mycena vitilis]|nr:hypothetical protein C8R47DRAFT_1214056 [Mycena vitilis]